MLQVAVEGIAHVLHLFVRGCRSRSAPIAAHKKPAVPRRLRKPYSVRMFCGEVLGRCFHGKHGLKFIAQRLRAFRYTKSSERISQIFDGM